MKAKPQAKRALANCKAKPQIKPRLAAFKMKAIS